MRLKLLDADALGIDNGCEPFSRAVKHLAQDLLVCARRSRGDMEGMVCLHYDGQRRPRL